jgi:signal transduction histidine kinase
MFAFPALIPLVLCGFVKVHQIVSLTTNTHRTGLGMAVAKRIIDAHDGVIAAGSDDGRGATISITLPRGKK